MYRSLTVLSRHHQHIRAVNAEYLSYSTTVRLVSIWLSKNCFSGILSHRDIELLVASIFTENPSALYPPQTSVSGFYRTLDRLGKHDFDVAPLVVNLDRECATAAAAAAPIDTVRHLENLKSTNPDSTKVSFILSMQDLVQHSDMALAVADSLIEKATLQLVQQRALVAAAMLSHAVAMNDDAASEAALEQLFLGQSSVMEQKCNVVLKFQPGLAVKLEAHQRGPQYANVKMYVNAPLFWSPDRVVVAEPFCTSANEAQESIVRTLRVRFAHIAVFFWDDTVGDKLYIIFKPTQLVQAMHFTPITARRKRSFNESAARKVAVPGDNAQRSSNSSIVLDTSQIVNEMMLSGNGCFVDVIFR